ncbi:MAG TPA: regulatory iron-sulfur-containing complex subunit RicT [Rhodothermales bacterium]|nr:regulatory iron-sulfur-containing complex subunit RicT [Rhodothermales bacterium]
MHVYDWLADMGIEQPVEEEIVEIIFKGGRKGFFRNPGRLELHAGDYVIVEADRGVDFGTVHLTGELINLRLRSVPDEGRTGLPRIVRLSGLTDLEDWKRNRGKEGEAVQIARGMVERLNLPMKIADVEWQFDRKRATFFFTSDRRVDFRKLVRELAGKFRTRIELRQIGVRDEAARLGGIGSCGRELCCSTWLEEFRPVTTQAAKVQDLPLNPVRLSGQCGRLKCCLNYELDQYMEALNAFPKIGIVLATETGSARVRKVDIFRDEVLVEFESSGQLESLPLATVNEILGRN